MSLAKALLCVLLMPLAIRSGSATPPWGELPQDTPAYWSAVAWHQHAQQLGNGGGDGVDDDDAYQAADVFLFLLPQLELDGRLEDARAAQQRFAFVIGLLVDDDLWARAYLPVGPYALGDHKAAEAQLAALADDPAAQLDALQMLAETAATLGHADDARRFTDRCLAELLETQRHMIALAKENGDSFDGLFTPWFLAHVARNSSDLDTMRRLAGLPLGVPHEAATMQAMLAQLLATDGKPDEAQAALDRGIGLLRIAIARHDPNDEDAWLEVGDAVPELVAAAWVLHGGPAAIRLGDDLDAAVSDADGYAGAWRTVAATYAATALRRLGQADAARAAAANAHGSFIVEMISDGDSVDSYALVQLAAEYTRQGDLHKARQLYNALPRDGLRASAALGISQALRDRE